MNKRYSLKITILDAVLEDEMVDELPNERLGCFLSYNGEFVDVIMIKEGSLMIKPDTYNLDLTPSKNPAEDKLAIIVKDIQKDEPYVGSVSIPREILIGGKVGQTYSQWITLFDDQDDDEYDGAMGLNDDEEPRILFEFTLSEVNVAPVPDMKSQVSPRASVKTID